MMCVHVLANVLANVRAFPKTAYPDAYALESHALREMSKGSITVAEDSLDAFEYKQTWQDAG